MQLRLIPPDIAKPFTRLVKRGTGRWLNLCAGADGELWKSHPRRYRVFYDRNIPAWISIDLAEWYARLHYYTGAYYDQMNPALIRRFLRPGDTFVDIGAHQGLHSLAASHVVGPAGRVYSFEPNPPTFRLLQAHLAINRVKNNLSRNVGLSDTAGELVLAGDESSRVSFRASDRTDGVRVPVVVGDEITAGDTMPGRLLIKIDTEGFEHHVIRGLGRLMERADCGVSVEITEKWLRETGSSTDALFDTMRQRDFSPMLLRKTRGSVRLEPLLKPIDEWQYDVLFVKPAFLDAIRSV